MQNTALLEYTITEAELDFLKSNLPDLSQNIYSETVALDWLDLAQSTDIIPQTLQNKINEFKNNPDKFGALYLKNLPVETIENGYTKATANSEIMLLAISKLLGKPMGCITKKQGIVISNVIPKKEDAQLEYNCDFVALLALRGDKAADTTLSFIDEKHLSKELLAELYKKNYIISSDVTFENSDSITTGVLAKLDDKLCVRYDPIYTECKTTQAKAALDELTTYVLENKFAVNLQKGDLLIINNNNSVHGRSEFKPRYDGTDRWVQRTTIVSKSIPKAMLLTDRPYVMNA